LKNACRAIYFLTALLTAALLATAFFRHVRFLPFLSSSLIKRR
jgi:hypothetical protein